MPPARKSAATKPAARASKATRRVRARAATTRQATRREVEQSIARFEKRLDDANDALKALGGHLGRGAQGSYKEMTAALVALRREASKTNKQALKDFDKLRAAITQKTPAASRSKSASKASSRASKASTTKASTRKASTRKASTSKTSTAKTSSRAKATRAKKS
jgi:hypothetical protein